jgi:homogentisate 1,2-dioxygenase
MDGCSLCNADGDFLIVPQQGSKFLGSVITRHHSLH